MRRNVNFINQRQFVREMNQQFAEHTALDEFATALVCTFFSPTRRLEFCNAGHPSPLLYQAKNNSWVLATAAANAVLASGIADTPLGAIDDAEYSRFEIQLEPGDMVLCVSDAFSDACDDRGERLGIEGLLAVVRELDVSQPDTLIETLTGRIQRDLHKHRFEDDATAVLFRSDGSSPSLSSDLIAPVRMLRGVRDATDLERVDETPHPVPPRRGTGATDGQAP
jgi:sigma-B regulation protein RsbU (phosphoserine phosphatase)